MAYVYVLECADGSLYTGSTRDLERRLWEHESGRGAKHTRGRLPVRLVFVEFFEDVGEAFAREKQIQGWSRRKKLALIASDWKGLIEAAKNRQAEKEADGRANEP
ncbi:MAG: GIY-YIG nuclease family protein [Geitlerinemataceae cyanobacterium]